MNATKDFIKETILRLEKYVKEDPIELGWVKLLKLFNEEPELMLRVINNASNHRKFRSLENARVITVFGYGADKKTGRPFYMFFFDDVPDDKEAHHIFNEDLEKTFEPINDDKSS